MIGGAVQVHLPADVLAQFGPYVRRTSFRETDYATTLRRIEGKYLPGCANSFVARSVFDKLGTFDANNAWGGSDYDFFFRARSAGVVMYFAPEAIIRHRIPPNRLTPAYLHWDAEQGCHTMAALQFKYQGRLLNAASCLARVGQTLGVLLPSLLWARLQQQAPAALDYRVRIWRNQGYLRRSLSLWAPRWFSQERHFAALKFRAGRTLSQDTPPMGAAT